MDFYLTKRGAKFFDSDVPKLISAINRLASSLENKNALSTVNVVKTISGNIEDVYTYPATKAGEALALAKFRALILEQQPPHTKHVLEPDLSDYLRDGRYSEDAVDIQIVDSTPVSL